MQRLTESRAISTRTFLLCFAAGAVVRIALTATTLGTNDVIFNIIWARLADKYGVYHAYAHHKDLNHPPLSLLLFHWFDLAGRAVGIEYTDVYRYVQSAADAVTTAVLLAIGRARGGNGRALALMFWLSPAAIFVSAFHCNTDATMLALLTGAVLLALLDRPAWSGVVLGLATGIKILPLLVVPLFFVNFLIRSRRAAAALRFTAALAAVGAAIFVPARVIGGPAVWRNIFLYSGFPGKWGVTGIFITARNATHGQLSERFMSLAIAWMDVSKFVLAAALAAFIIWFWRALRRDSHDSLLPAAVSLVYLIAIFLAPGFGVQYLVWPLPLLPFAIGRRWSLALNAAISAYLFITYTIWCAGFPWWYADSIAASPLKPWVVLLGFPLWIAFGAAAIYGVRRFTSERFAARSA